jgi:hypothetical protein
MNEWQPIDTAPRDGRTIIAYRPTDPPHIEGMYWANYEKDNGAWHWSYDGESSLTIPPSHWMPLPEPPQLK